GSPVARQGILEIDHGNVVGASVCSEQVALAVAATPKRDAVRVGKAYPCRIRGKQRDRRRRPVRRDKRNRKIGTRKTGIAQSKLDLPSQAAGPPVDERDSVAAVLGEVALRVADNKQVGKEHEAHRSEMTTIDMPLERRDSSVIVPLYRLLDVVHRDVSSSAVL